MDLYLENGIVVTPSGPIRGAVAVTGETISAVGTDLKPEDGCRRIDLRGAYLLPGGIDAHTHFDMDAGDIKTSDDFLSGTRAAVAGGTTTVIDFAEPESGRPLQQGLDAWHRKADGRSFCDYGFHMTVTGWDDTTGEQMKSMVDQGVSSFKLYTAYQGMQVSDDVLYKALKQSRELGALVCVHCENGNLLEALIAEKKRENPADIGNHPLSRPPLVEKEAVSRVIDIARLAGASVYIVHLSAAESLETALRQRERGAKVFLETCPHYLLLDDEKYKLPDFESAKFVMSPPLRGKADCEALWGALKTGEIQTVSTDHCSFNYQGQKELGRGDFTKIPNGIPSVEHRMSLLYSYGVSAGRITLPQFVKLTAENPAKIFGLYPKKGVIAPGSDADLIVLEELPKDKETQISARTQLQYVDYTPYEGIRLKNRIRMVFLRGRCVMEDGTVAEKPQGSFLRRTAIK